MIGFCSCQVTDVALSLLALQAAPVVDQIDMALIVRLLWESDCASAVDNIAVALWFVEEDKCSRSASIGDQLPVTVAWQIGRCCSMQATEWQETAAQCPSPAAFVDSNVVAPAGCRLQCSARHTRSSSSYCSLK